MMEFDFLNVGGKESGDLAEEGSRGSRDDKGSAILWPSLDNASPLQHFKPFKTQQEQKSKNVLFNPIPVTEFPHFSAVEAFESNQKAHIVQVPQSAIHAYQNQDVNIYAASKVHDLSSGHNLTRATVSHQPSGSDVLKNTPSVGSEVGAIFPRKMSKPTTSAQLTIFYAGSVNVYDDIPCDTAQNVFLMASEICKAATNAADFRPEAPALPVTEESVSGHPSVAQTPKMAGNHAVSSGLSSTLSLASHIGNQSYVPIDDKVGEKTREISSQTDPSKNLNASMGAVTAAIILPIAVPQARKASLARFLEKRKERASSWMPYSCDKTSDKTQY